MIDYKRFQAELRKKFKDKYCLIPGCKNKRIIHAHTVQKKGGITAIARDGIVYTFNGLGKNLIEMLRANDCLNYGFSDDGRIHYWQEPDQVGISKASTITAFCSEHDRDIFASIELERFIPTEKQVHLYALRCLASELYKKHAASKESINRLMKDFIHDEKMKQFADIHTEGSRIGEEDISRVFSSCTLDWMTNHL